MDPTGLIPALDSDERTRILDWARLLAPESALLKVGLQAFVAHGPELVRDVVAHGPVFLDLKLHDIPNTVAGAARAVGDLGVSMLTVHASGGAEMIAAAAEAVPNIQILGVTVLTSLGAESLGELGHPSADQQVPRLAALAVAAGAAGVVCSAAEIEAVRSAIGDDPLIVVPGIRPAGAATDDQARTATPAQAMQRGATHVVVGRPITQAAEPVSVARDIGRQLRVPA